MDSVISKFRPLILALVMIVMAAGAATASCTGDLTLRNTGSSALRVVTDDVRLRRSQNLTSSFFLLWGQVRVPATHAWLPWRRARQGGWMPNRAELVIPAGGTRTSEYRASANCDRLRQVDVPYTCADGPRGGRTYSVQQYWGPGRPEVELPRC
jgi:hypothetical protein